MQTIPQAPTSIAELSSRAEALAGLTLGQLSAQIQQQAPTNLLRKKGWAGQLLELALGATAGSRPEPDFPHLGVELKTLPIDDNFKPLETTFVCVAPLTGITGMQWQDSGVYKKLRHVLWVPILASKQLPIAERQIGTPFLWQPNPQQEASLRQDWEEIMEQIALGNIQSLNGHTGEYLQLRPKAANGSKKTQAIGRQGQSIQTLPRGFYLKIPFTHGLLKNAFGLI